MADQSNFNPAAIPFGAGTPAEALETWIATTQGRGMTLIVAGQSGAGKSTLVKNLLRLKEEDGVPKIKHSPSSVTEEVQVYEHEVDGVPVKLVDMPGLAAPDQNEKDIITQLQKVTNGEADMLLYCTSMAPCSRLGNTDRGIVQLLTSIFKEQIWEKTILVLTFADLAKAAGDKKIVKEEDIEMAMEETVNDYAKGFEKILTTIVKSKSQQFSVLSLDPKDMSSPRKRFQIAAIPTSCTQREKLLHQISWDDHIYLEVLRKCSRDAIPAFLKISKTDIDVTKIGQAAMGGALISAPVYTGALVGAYAGATVGGAVGGAVMGPIGVVVGTAAVLTITSFAVSIIVQRIQ